MTKSLLDYYGDDEVPEEELTFQGLKKHWFSTVEKESGSRYHYQWTAADQASLSRLMKEYSPKDIVTMMDFTINKHPRWPFLVLYRERHHIHQHLFKPKDYGYD